MIWGSSNKLLIVNPNAGPRGSSPQSCRVFAAEVRKKRSASTRGLPQWRWHLDKVFVRINGETPNGQKTHAACR
jgi:hypothetical protein